MVSLTYCIIRHSKSLKGYIFLSVFLYLFFVPLLFSLLVYSYVCLSVCISGDHLHKCFNNDYNNQLDTYASLSCLVKEAVKIEEN